MKCIHVFLWFSRMSFAHWNGNHFLLLILFFHSDISTDSAQVAFSLRWLWYCVLLYRMRIYQPYKCLYSRWLRQQYYITTPTILSPFSLLSSLPYKGKTKFIFIFIYYMGFLLDAASSCVIYSLWIQFLKASFKHCTYNKWYCSVMHRRNDI